MSHQSDMEAQREETKPGQTVEAIVDWKIEVKNVETPALCHCGADVDPDLIELRAFFPSLPSLCPKCYEIAQREEEEQARRDRENADHRHRLAILDQTVPPEILATNLSHPTFNKPLFIAVQGWSPDNGRWLFIHGSPGACKTRVVGLIVKRLILDGTKVTWMTAGDLQDAVEALATFGKGDSRRYAATMDLLDTWEAAPVLVLDDLGKNLWSPAIEAKLFKIVDHRKSHFLPTIITANSGIHELLREMLAANPNSKRAGPIMGRIKEASTGWTIDAAKP